MSVSVFPPLKERAIKDTLVLFDVDGTLTPARRDASPEMLLMLQKLRTQVAIGFVGGSDLPKQQEQLGSAQVNVVDLFDYAFAENGLTAYRESVQLVSTSFISWLGEDRYKQLVKFILHHIADLDIPIKRGTFIEFRNGMINVSPVGRNASTQERHDFEAYDKIHNVRRDMVEALKKNFPDLAVTYSIGGQISFDVFPTGWDKTYCLRHVESDGWKTVHFFGDKTFKGGNDYEIYNDPRVIGHTVTKPEDTMALLNELFLTGL
ncbi:Phosphomannomutase [Taphrina deformans PYCC 5710]|uniref:Phosphomannomutase n=1 Tax=Taphrina deformans (strain PYCC 5710 / ATCC 11124 / CBS 356.35 / IMI 108563 / JCM 9778 / NBRC 8474) TaxID=1097556 RepID=R4XJH4_TAPDE|nr:Phosphomannomutase [Taphrina deformans PYCC 5710]|eukprot:CCG83500.1 Phosphomannomutase [Taphrina deformans PYCC 5710]